MKHPRDFGFALGLKIKVVDHGKVTIATSGEQVKTLRDVVYVALLQPGGECLKVGFTTGTAFDRWKSACRTFDRAPGERKSLRANEIKDGERFVALARGKTIEVWFKAAERAKLSYADLDYEVSLRAGEEAFLDGYYQPLFGRKLEIRRDPESHVRASP